MGNSLADPWMSKHRVIIWSSHSTPTIHAREIKHMPQKTFYSSITDNNVYSSSIHDSYKTEITQTFINSSAQLLSHVQLFVTTWTAAHQASLSITISWSLPKLMSIELVMPSNHLILCCPLLLLPSIFPSIRVFSYESTLRMRWPKYWSFSFNISPDITQDWYPLGWTGWLFLQSKGLSRVFSNTTVQKHQFFGAQLSL